MPGINYGQQALPAWLERMNKELGELIAEQTNVRHRRRPMEVQEILADIQPETLWAMRRARLMNNQIDPFSEFSLIRSQQLGDPIDYNAYANPYIDAELSNIENVAQRNLDENLLPALTAHYVGLGQHGSTGHSKLSKRALRDTLDHVSKMQQEVMAREYNLGADTAESERERMLDASAQSIQARKLQEAQELQELSSLYDQGKSHRQREQAELNHRYQESLRAYQEPLDMLAQRAAILGGNPAPMSEYHMNVPQAQPELNRVGQLGQLAGNLYGAGQMAGMFKRGGYVRPRRMR